ncbi:MAG: UvrB/UvrC motif-containing protein [Phycisphaerales bacterium]|jgi:hypothetical protein|nr:UvrB/UvrC motif-containing protein [Phycisphaerales bacterium]MBT7171382.1 UvrB/UvrC motif-containing protein [Phycisphaerales bacterium]
MSLDIRTILDDWPHRPGEVNCRRIIGKDGEEKIQMRLDLGLLQMEAKGRPDGKRPHGFESLLDYHEHRLKRHFELHGPNEPFRLSEVDCRLLREEGMMYYHRYLATFVLEDYASVARDTARNLRLFDLINRYARTSDDRFVLEGYRPYVIMMNTRARANLEMGYERYREAIEVVEAGKTAIAQLYDAVAGDDDEVSECGEWVILDELASEIREKIPVDPTEKLMQKLNTAIDEERYEDAARLRDQLSTLRSTASDETTDLF